MDPSSVENGAASDICAYEVERDSRRKALHDAVQKNLVEAGFLDVVAIRSAFPGEGISVVQGQGSSGTRRKRRNKSEQAVHPQSLRRTTRVSKPAVQLQLAEPSASLAKKKEEFCAWPGKASCRKRKGSMKKGAGLQKKRMSASPEPLRDTNGEEEGTPSPQSPLRLTGRVTVSPERPSSIFEEENANVHAPRWERESQFSRRPPPTGYRIEDYDRRGGSDWGHQYPREYGNPATAPYRGSSHRPRSPTPYGGGAEYGGRPADYERRGATYKGRFDYNDRKGANPYYDSRGRDFDRRPRQYDEPRRYEDGRYERRGTPVDMYASASAGESQYARARMARSPPPSSSAIVENEVKSSPKIKRPLHVDKYGNPCGAMASLFNADINSFVKDMDPRVGWSGQTKEARQRLIDRLLDDYDVLGDSSKLSEKYVGKQAGAGLTQYRFTLNHYIDKGCNRPSDLNKIYWDDMVEKRASKEGKEMSERMASIARGRGSKGTTKKAVHESVIISLTRHLKRDSYQIEIEESFEREWASVQEEIAEKKKLRTVASATAAGTSANEAILKQLDAVENFMRKWGEEFEGWKQQMLEVKQLTVGKGKASKISTPERTKEAPKHLVLGPDDKGLEKGALESEHVHISSEEEDGSEDAKSSAHEDAESDEDVHESDEDNAAHSDAVETEVAVPVVQTQPMEKSARPPADYEPSQSKARSETKAPGTSNVVVQKSNVHAALPKKGKDGSVVRVSTRTNEKNSVAASEKNDGSIQAEKAKEIDPRPGKRQRVDSKSTAEAAASLDETAVEISQKQDVPLKGTKSTRKNVKAADVKGDKGGKKGK